MNIRDITGSLFWLSVSIFVFVMSIRIGVGDFRAPGPGLFGFCSSVLLGALSITLALAGLAKSKERQGIFELWRGVKWGKVLLLIISLLSYPILLPLMGFTVTTFVVMVLLFRLTGVQRLSAAVGIGLLTAAGSYVIFGIFLKVALPHGMMSYIP